MSTYTQILYQIVFSTKRREKTLTKDRRDDMFKFMSGILKNKNCHLYQIGGVEDHIHIVTHIHPTVALANLVKDIELGSTAFIKEEKLFRNFDGWQEGYGAFTYSKEAKENLIRYVMNQEEHHRKKTYKEEFIEILEEHDLDFDERYFL